MRNIFKESGITFSMDERGLKICGLSKLPGNRADEIRQQVRENKNEIIMAVQCPARCKNTGFCYGLAYFEGRPGKHVDCSFLDCRFQQVQKNKVVTA